MKLNIKDLTEEQIKDLELQLQDYRKQKEPHFTDVKSWEDAFEIVKPKLYIDYEVINTLNKEDDDEFIVIKAPSELHAKSILATCRLTTIATVLNGKDWKPTYGPKSIENGSNYLITYNYFNEKLEYILSDYNILSGIVFKSSEIAEYAMSQFKDLFLDMLMIERWPYGHN